MQGFGKRATHAEEQSAGLNCSTDQRRADASVDAYEAILL